MTTLKKTAQPVSVQEEVEALFLEGKKALPESLVDLHEEYNKINEQIAELEARKTVIKSIVGLQADMDGVSMYTVNGVNALGFNFVTRTNVDRKKLAAKYPDVYADEEIISTSQTSSFYSKK